MQDFLKALEEAEMVLVGLGEEFDAVKFFKSQEQYQKGKEYLEERELHWLLPVYNESYRKQTNCGEVAFRVTEKVRKALESLEKLLQNKNYFVVSTALNEVVSNIPWKEKRLVTPCGDSRKKQCPMGCKSGLQQVTKEEIEATEQWIQLFQKQVSMQEAITLEKAAFEQGMMDGSEEIHKIARVPFPDLGTCPECGKPLVFNSVYAPQYDENGYLEQWQIYTKWLQGTLNRKVLILELGVGMQFPSVIRFPFEKAAFFNQKANFYRVNEKLYQLTEEIKEKGVSIPQNSIDWLLTLC